MQGKRIDSWMNIHEDHPNLNARIKQEADPFNPFVFDQFDTAGSAVDKPDQIQSAPELNADAQMMQTSDFKQTGCFFEQIPGRGDDKTVEPAVSQQMLTRDQVDIFPDKPVL